MKIKFQIKKPITSQSKDIHEKILTFLDSSGYRVVQNTQQNISFDDEKGSEWRITSNIRYYELTEGKFGFTTVENINILNLSYSVDITFEILFSLTILFCGIYADHIYLFALLFIMFSLLLKFYFLWSQGKNMLKSILA